MSTLLRRGTKKSWARKLFSTALHIFHDYLPADVQSLLLEVRLSRKMFAEDLSMVDPKQQFITWVRVWATLSMISAHSVLRNIFICSFLLVNRLAI